MRIDNVQNTTFGSTRITLTKADEEMFIHKLEEKYTSPLSEKGYYNIKQFLSKLSTPRRMADNIPHNFDAGCFMTFGKNGRMYIDFFGKNQAEDREIGKILTEEFKNAKFFDNLV